MFGRILRDLIDSTPGAIGALFLDYEGETVAMLSERPFELSDDDLRIVGAYQGIFLTQLRELCTRVAAGEPQRFKLDFEGKRILSTDLKDGYYVVLIVDESTNEGLAWRELGHCRARLMHEM